MLAAARRDGDIAGTEAKTMIRKRLDIGFSAILLAVCVAGGTDRALGSEEVDGIAVVDSHIARGRVYFEEAYYRLIPSRRESQAAERFSEAIIEFEKAILANPENQLAYRMLARVFHVQGRYAEAAEAYRQLSALNPSDIDVYVRTALVLSYLHRFGESIDALRTAKTRTTDYRVIERLDGYIRKLENARSTREGAR